MLLGGQLYLAVPPGTSGYITDAQILHFWIRYHRLQGMFTCFHLPYYVANITYCKTWKWSEHKSS
jgi:hypothetical protein